MQLIIYQSPDSFYYERLGKKLPDMVLSLNGLPIATIEPKKSISGQSVDNAKKVICG
jgi:type I restriction enzyme R subunit